jgi:ABC-type branched-subunit amino acid transport system ATPase component/branched-subunit amino acid ABC-type transport system permease component
VNSSITWERAVWNELSTFVITGLTAGAVYGLAGSGLVITYKTTGVFNFAIPALAAVSSYIFFFLHYDTIYLDWQLSWQVSAAIAILVAGPLMGLFMELIVRGLSVVSTPYQVVATIGLSLGIVGALGLFYQDSGVQPYYQYLPIDTFKVAGAFVSYDQLILFLFALISVAALYVFFRVARLGVGMRAVVDSPELLDLSGASPVAVRRWAWVIGATFAAAAGVLLGPVINSLSAGSYVALMVASFGAAAIGAFTSLPLTFLGGLAIGVAGDISQNYVGDVEWLGGLRGALPFIVLFIVLIVVKPSKLREKRIAPPKPESPSYYAPWKVRVVAGAIAIGLLALVPQMSFFENDLIKWTEAMSLAILFLSLGLLVKMAGQVSLAHTALAAVGGAAFAHASTDWGLPWLLALLVAGLITAGVGLIISVPAIRVSGVFLALATYGFALFLQQMIYPTKLMFGKEADGIFAPRPSFAESNTSYYYLVLAFAVIVAMVMVWIHYARMGRLLRALGDSPGALNTMGTTTNVVLVSVFCISAFLAAIAGALYAGLLGNLNTATPQYLPTTSLVLFAVVMLVAAGTPWFGLACTFAFVLVPYFVDKWFHVDNIASYTVLLFGASGIIVANTADKKPGVPKSWIAFFERFRTKPVQPELTDATSLVRTPPDGDGLAIDGLTVRFGGLTAVDGLTLHAPFGRITGLIGPNGAGKTTTFNACSGLVRPSSGQLTYNGTSIVRRSPAARARMGIGRTFQLVQLWESLTVMQNIALGREAPMAGGSVIHQLSGKPGDRATIDEAVAEAVELTGTGDILDRRVSDLSTAERRLVELARALAGPFDLLLLDEPSSGLDATETREFGELLQNVVRLRGTAILLVEHDMSLVTQVCSYIYVMDFGRLVFEGPPQEVMASSIVRAAYLGSPDDAELVAVEEASEASGATEVPSGT